MNMEKNLTNELPKILIADDDGELRRLLRFTFGYGEFVIYTATNGEQALQLAEELRPSAMILDVMMPIVDGVEVCRRIKANPLTMDIYTIILTGFDTPSTRHAIVEAKADAYLVKPFSPMELIRIVETMPSMPKGNL